MFNVEYLCYNTAEKNDNINNAKHCIRWVNDQITVFTFLVKLHL